MAIFGKADYDLPLITHMAQANPERDDEMLHLLIVMTWQNGRDAEERLGWSPEDIVRFTMDSDEEPYVVERLRRMSILIQAVLENLYEHGGVTAKQQQDLASYTLQSGLYFLSPEPGTTFIPIAKMVERRRPFQPADWLWSRVSEWLLTALWASDIDRGVPLDLKRCAECNGFFIEMGRRRKYCSHRCANRVSQRKRGQKRRNALITL